MLRLEDKSFRLEDTNHWLADRLADNLFLRLSASLYSINNVRVTAMLEDMVDFFSYTTYLGVISSVHVQSFQGSESLQRRDCSGCAP